MPMKATLSWLAMLVLYPCLPLYAENAELVIGVEDISYLPYYSVDNGEYHGYSRELLDAFAKDSGYHVTYQPLPVERLFRSLFNGSIDCKYPDNQKWRADLKANVDIHYSDPVARFIDGVMVVPARLPSPIDSFRSIGTIRGFSPWPLLDSVRHGKMIISENNTMSGLLRQALAGRVDGVYINTAVANYQLRNILGQPNALVFSPALPNIHAVYQVSTIHRQDIILALNVWMSRNKTWIENLRKKFGIDIE